MISTFRLIAVSYLTWVTAASNAASNKANLANNAIFAISLASLQKKSSTPNLLPKAAISEEACKFGTRSQASQLAMALEFTNSLLILALAM